MKVAAEDIKKGFGRTDESGKHVVWTALNDAVPASTRGHVLIRVEFDDGTFGNRLPKVGEEIEGVYVTRRRAAT